MKLALLSNINIDLLSKGFTKKYQVFKPDGYGSWAQQLLDQDSQLAQFDPDLVFLLLDGEELFPIERIALEQIEQQIISTLSYIRDYAQRNERVKVFVATLDMPLRQLRSFKDLRIERKVEALWYNQLAELSDQNDNLFFFDYKRIIEQIGRQQFYSRKLWYLGGIKFSPQGEKLLRKEMERIIQRFIGKRKKCLVLDLDHTLWGGVIGEDGLDGIELADVKEGARFKDFQKRIREIKQTGTILAVVSKNNPADALEVFQQHQHMVLKEDDFVSMKINWEPKVANLKTLANELNISLDSFVFIDDNPVERASVQMELPQVVVPEFPKDTAELEDFITDVFYDYFAPLQATEEDRYKSEMYKQNISRHQELRQAHSLDDFLKGLQTKIHIGTVQLPDVERVAQLTQKTNQFNLTTKRYTSTELRNLLNSPEYDLFVASVEDKFGDNGKVVVLIVKKLKAQTVELDTFLMSCRVMGRNLEDQIIDYVENYYLQQGVQNLITYFNPTKKNQPVAQLFERLGYNIKEKLENGSKIYELDLTQERPERKQYGELLER